MKEISKTLKIQKILSIITIIIGIVLISLMITVEDEPGALPLFLIVLGVLWFVISQYQIKKQLRKE